MSTAISKRASDIKLCEFMEHCFNSIIDRLKEDPALPDDNIDNLASLLFLTRHISYFRREDGKKDEFYDHLLSLQEKRARMSYYRIFGREIRPSHVQRIVEKLEGTRMYDYVEANDILNEEELNKISEIRDVLKRLSWQAKVSGANSINGCTLM